MKTWTPEDLQKHLEQGDKVFLKVWRNGCAPCKASIPTVSRLEGEFSDVVFGEISTDDHPEIIDVTGVRGVPTFFVFADKELKGQSVGFQGEGPLRQLLKDIGDDSE